MITESELRALPPEEQERLFLAQALVSEPGKLVMAGDFIPTVGEAPPCPESAIGSSPPGLLSMAANFAGSVAGHFADRGRIAPPEVQAERERACFSNACGQHDAEKDACSACGCGSVAALSFIGLDLKLKRSWASSRCPADPSKWDSV